MPRDGNGVYTPARDWEDDAANDVPFSPERWNEQDADFADALNDLPLASWTPRAVPSGTDPATVNAGSLMEHDGRLYIRLFSQPIWREIGAPGLTDLQAIITAVSDDVAATLDLQPTIDAAVDTIRAGVAANLDTLPEIVALIGDQIAESDASALGLQILAAADAAAVRTLAAAAAATHGHAIGDVTGLQTALDGKEPTLAAASTLEMEAGTESAHRKMSPANIAEAIAALAGGDIADGAVTTAKIANDAVTADKLADTINATIAGKADQTALDATNTAVAGKADAGHTHAFSALTGVTVSTGDPSGGADGDIWIKYTP